MSTEPDNSDVLQRLDNWRGVHMAHVGELIQDAALEIRRLRIEVFALEAAMHAIAPAAARGLSPMTITSEPEDDEDDERIFHSETHKPD
jgi:hypothetical protein